MVSLQQRSILFQCKINIFQFVYCLFRCRVLHKRAKDFLHDNCCLANTAAFGLRSKLKNQDMIYISYKNDVCSSQILQRTKLWWTKVCKSILICQTLFAEIYLSSTNNDLLVKFVKLSSTKLIPLLIRQSLAPLMFCHLWYNVWCCQIVVVLLY